MRSSGSLLSSFILFVFSFSPFWRVLSHFVATFLGLWKCGVTIVECAHVYSFAQSAWNVYNLPRTAAAEISTELDESWMCVCLSLKLLQSLVWSHPLPPRFPSQVPSWYSLCQFPRSLTFWHKAGNPLSARVDHVESCSRLASILAGQGHRGVGPCRLHILSKSEVRVLQLQLSPLLLL